MNKTQTPANATLARLAQGHLSDAELQAGFLAARSFGNILQDEVIVSIVQAVICRNTPETPSMMPGAEHTHPENPQASYTARNCPVCQRLRAGNGTPKARVQVNRAFGLSSAEAQKALMNVTGFPADHVNDMMRKAQNAWDGMFSARTALDYGYTIYADDDAQAWNLTYESEVDE